MVYTCELHSFENAINLFPYHEKENITDTSTLLGLQYFVKHSIIVCALIHNNAGILALEQNFVLNVV